MIRKLARSMLVAQIISALTVSLCLLIDNVMIGRFLGLTALSAYSLSGPVLLATGAFGMLLATGVQVVCSNSLGRGLQQETNAGYSSAIAISGAISLVMLAAVLIFAGPIASGMGAGAEGELYDQTRGYLIGFIIGTPASIGSLVLVPFLQMAGQGTLLIVAVLSMTVADIAFDLMNVLIFHGGMFGMGLASSLSYYVAVIISLVYFMSKKSAFRFSIKQVTHAKIGEILKGGAPLLFGMVASMALMYTLNQLMMWRGGTNAVAAYSVVNTLGNASASISTGIGGVTLTLANILYNEEDRTGLRQLMKQIARSSISLGLITGALLMVAAPYLVALFIGEAGETQTMATLGLRMFALCLIPCCLNEAFKNLYQATSHVVIMEIISVAQKAAFPILAAFVFSAALGIDGIWLYAVGGEILSLIGILIYIAKKSGRPPLKNGAYLLLGDGFGVSANDLLETDISSIEEVEAASQAAGEFCRQRGLDERICNRIELCVEEMAANTIQHGFKADGREHHLSIRLQRKADRLVLRFRDDCGAFDPAHYVPAEGEDALGIRLVTGMADEVRYTYSLNLNNLMIVLKCGEPAAEGV